jgi:hypothetical protein
LPVGREGEQSLKAVLLILKASGSDTEHNESLFTGHKKYPENK